VLKITGALIKKALENAVSKYPILDGRWPMVSGLKFAFDPKLPPGQRVTWLSKCNGDPIIETKQYTLAT